MAEAGIVFEDVGIGDALLRSRLEVPINQREYSWEEKHIHALFHDLENAIALNQLSYFLGTVVLTGGNKVTDGQQRLATITILLAAIRDHFCEKHDEKMIQSIEADFLFTIERRSRRTEPRLSLNVVDNEFFRRRILSRVGDKDRAVATTCESHIKIATAAEMAGRHVRHILSAVAEKHHDDRLNQWIDYIQKKARIILLRVPDELNAYVMFETLNDRGLKTSQSDLVKNHLFSKVGNRLAEAQEKWSCMRGALETLEEDDITVTYLRHLLNVLSGPTREKEVMTKIEERSREQASALEFLDTLAEYAMPYVAIQVPTHSSWGEYPDPSVISKSIVALIHLRADQIRPLMLAVRRRFTPKETARAFRMFVSWVVRVLIVGSRGGTLEEAYPNRAHEIYSGSITDAAQLCKSMEGTIPSDEMFRAEFAGASVSKHYLARYYLRSLELTVKEDKEPEFIPNEDRVITLEHIIPKNPENNWPQIEPALAEAMCNRLGNMILLPATPNSDIGNLPFNVKAPVYRKSGYALTSEVATRDGWNTNPVAEVKHRQEHLADLAVRTWPLFPR